MHKTACIDLNAACRGKRCIHGSVWRHANPETLRALPLSFASVDILHRLLESCHESVTLGTIVIKDNVIVPGRGKGSTWSDGLAAALSTSPRTPSITSRGGLRCRTGLNLQTTPASARGRGCGRIVSLGMGSHATFALGSACNEDALLLVPLALPAAVDAVRAVGPFVVALQSQLLVYSPARLPEKTQRFESRAIGGLTLTLRHRHVSQPLYLPATPTMLRV